MTQYCSGSTKATVFYQFNGSPQQAVIVEKNLPITVEVTQTSDPDKPSGACDGWNWFRQWTGEPCATLGYGWRCLNDLNPNSVWSVVMYCGFSQFTNDNSCNGIYFYKNGELIEDSPPWYSHCGLIANYFQFFPRKYCLTVRDSTNNIVFQKYGDDVCTFKVACDNDCPPGTHKCVHKDYPGYCCIPCKDTASKIKELASKITNK